MPELSLAVAAGRGFSAERTPTLISDGDDDLVLTINTEGIAHASQLGRETSLSAFEAVLLSSADVGRVQYPGLARFIVIAVPRKAVAAMVRDPEAVVGKVLPAHTQGLRLLTRYVTAFDDDAATSPELRHAFATHVRELLALAIGTTVDAAEIARGGGVRAARLQAVLAEIKGRYANPGLSSGDIARALGLSERYVQDLLHHTGLHFTERVLELRLQKACAMLASAGHRRKVIEIALACGFGDISYFNRCFRRRFGASPSAFFGTKSRD
jgi:AraC-like DNA-binding protein